jgi:hypothetical protein
VADVLGQDRPQVPFAGDEHPVSALSPRRAHETLGVSVHPGRLGRDRQCRDPDRGEHGVERRSELGFVRRSMATSCRSASISTFLADEDRASSASQDNTVTSTR